ncbi:uncharacterized protein PAC_05611 [Phialocephala subalpina]|uniref:Uncharacterized protein n=1 Tax=Phialocephala subalpina TaxID=576137 RepID=A0A1L7WSJ2_9HELO|nr:uncharacterized protein PAC_05611 [Phialocephala subalpina]
MFEGVNFKPPAAPTVTIFCVDDEVNVAGEERQVVIDVSILATEGDGAVADPEDAEDVSKLAIFQDILVEDIPVGDIQAEDVAVEDVAVEKVPAYGVAAFIVESDTVVVEDVVTATYLGNLDLVSIYETKPSQSKLTGKQMPHELKPASSRGRKNTT